MALRYPGTVRYLVRARVKAGRRAPLRNANGSEPWACDACDCTLRLECKLAGRGEPFLEELRSTAEMEQTAKWKTRLVEGAFPDRAFDMEFWQEQGDEAIFRAAWEMVELAEEVKYGRKPALQRTVTHLE